MQIKSLLIVTVGLVGLSASAPVTAATATAGPGQPGSHPSPPHHDPASPNPGPVPVPDAAAAAAADEDVADPQQVEAEIAQLLARGAAAFSQGAMGMGSKPPGALPPPPAAAAAAARWNCTRRTRTTRTQYRSRSQCGTPKAGKKD